MPAREALTREDFTLLLRFVRNIEDFTNQRYSIVKKSRLVILYTLMFLTGLRIMEAAGVTFDMADDLFIRERAHIKVNRPKQKKKDELSYIDEDFRPLVKKKRGDQK